MLQDGSGSRFRFYILQDGSGSRFRFYSLNRTADSQGPNGAKQHAGFVSGHLVAGWLLVSGAQARLPATGLRLSRSRRLDPTMILILYDI